MPSFPAFEPHLDAALLVVGLQGAYLAALRFVGPRHVEPGEPPASRRHVALFSLGVLTLWVASTWPMHDLSERFLYSAHMVQHLLFTLVAPPLLLLGTPDWLARWLLRPVMPVARVVLRPFPALLLFNGVIVLTHWPLAVEWSVRSEPLHFALHAVLVLTALAMWWPVLSPLAEIPRLSYPGQMLYLFLQSIVPTVPASFLTFGSEPLYRIYETFPRLWGISALADQQAAGLIMKLGGGLILWGVVAAVFFRWASADRTGRPDVVEWQSVEREVNRIGTGPR